MHRVRIQRILQAASQQAKERPLGQDSQTPTTIRREHATMSIVSLEGLQVSIIKSILSPVRIRRLARVLVTVVATIVAAPAAAQLDFPNRRGSFTPGELAMLPEYCRDIHGMPTYDGPRGNHWRSVFGANVFEGMHHYCRGLRDILFTQMLVLKPLQRNFVLGRAIDEFNFMIRISGPTMVLLPEIYLRRADAEARLGLNTAAEQSFKKSSELKPDYAPLYPAWADFLVSIKLNDRAQAVLEAGLVHLPEDRGILERLARLTGGRRSPAPARPASAPAPEAPASQRSAPSAASAAS
jgi:hypothetical protein